MGMSHFSDIAFPQMEPTFIPGVGGTPHMKGLGMVVGNFELNPEGDRSGRSPSFF